MECPEFLARQPEIHPSAFIAPDARLVGAVTIGEDASVWYHAVLRGDIERIAVGRRSNIQDACVIHLSSSLGVRIGDDVTVGHSAIIHAAEIEDEVLVGMGSIVMDGACVGSGSIIGAGTLVTQGCEIPPGSLVLGRPGKVVRAVNEEELAGIRNSAEKYVHVARHHRALIEREQRNG